MTRDTQREFRDVARALEGRLIGYLNGMVRHTPDAEDLFQDVMITLHEHWEEVAHHPNLDAWVFRVAHNRAANWIRRRVTERRALEKLSAPRPDPMQPPADQTAEKTELQRAVADALATLDGEQRSAINLRLKAECSWREIGDVLGCSRDTAARIFDEALRRIEPKLASHTVHTA